MSAAAAAEAPAPKGKGKKKLIIIVAGVVLLLAVAGAAAMVMMKKKAAAEEDGGDGAPAKAAQVEKKEKPIFVPLDPFTVNLADHDADRYAQVGITLQVTDEKVAELIKTYMPAIRNNILLALSDHTAAQLLARDGKARLADQLRRETARAMGYAVPPDDAASAPADESGSGDNADADPPKKKRKKGKAAELPITAIQFSNFIIQ
ncbi:MAG: flagellar basal body-associated FliL family protein [Burkholderiales bacterium]|nr:flagellar basal body-associated FliL family protein [Burkholderiales bacterium]MDE2454575.1 flagellar basal body-associated FliL family protein [Burkholderiales bacterium]